MTCKFCSWFLTSEDGTGLCQAKSVNAHHGNEVKSFRFKFIEHPLMNEEDTCDDFDKDVTIYLTGEAK